jgi:hypothetical protein
MRQNLKASVKALMPGPVRRNLKSISESASTLREILRDVAAAPVCWDEASVQLDQLRSEAGRVGYPQYLYGLLCAARTAKAVGAKEFTAIEFGVASGNGLVAMEEHAITVGKRWGMSIQVVGFDTSKGLPPRTDPRDCPFAFRGGEFKMDEPKLRARLKHAQLRLGDVAETVRGFATENFPPIGFISNDLDLYTSTRDSFALLELQPHQLLPRVAMYFDDLVSYPYSTVSGEWAAIHEFNSNHQERQIGQLYGLKHHIGRAYRFALWVESFFVFHVFNHKSYNLPEVTTQPDLTLRT